MRKLNLAPARTPIRLSLISLLTACAMGAIAPQAMADQVRIDPRVKDLGVAAPTDYKTITLALGLRNPAALDTFIASLSDPASPNFRHFITPQQFAVQYGQSTATVAQVRAYLEAQGFRVTHIYGNNLLISATGTNAQIAATFGTTIHNYSDATGTYQAPASAAVMPAQLASVAVAVTGLSTRASRASHRVNVPNTGVLTGDAVGLAKTAPATTATNPVGNWTSLDLAAKYNINPLYHKGLTGAGKTVGIATLAGYNQADAYAYWHQIGLTVNPTRIVDVLIDGGALPADGPGSDGAGETTLDVEQSGGVAPGANVRVYIAPNTDSGFVDVFAHAIDENLIDVLSVSWGSPEVAYDQPTLTSYHNIFAQAAAQGIPVIAAAGDAGAFDINRSYTYPACTTFLSVDFPAADPLVLAAGGTTLPNTFEHKLGPVTETVERPWGWNYLQNYILTYYGQATYYSSYYVVGGGGGVSVKYPVPSYQAGVKGVLASASAQALICGPDLDPTIKVLTGWELQYTAPANYAGRNLPDVSLNADPYSGYAVYQSGWSGNSGGTSFVSPQLNGILTLISEGIPATAANPYGRVGQINPQLYASFKTHGYTAGSPFKAITSGDNEYYKATNTYNPASGLGSLDVSALATALGVQ